MRLYIATPINARREHTMKEKLRAAKHRIELLKKLLSEDERFKGYTLHSTFNQDKPKARDWSNWQCPKSNKPKFDPKTLQPFDRVLARIDGGNAYCWFADFVSTPTIEKYDLLPCIMSNKDANMIIPYNEDTKHLVGTTEEAPEYYRYWED